MCPKWHTDRKEQVMTFGQYKANGGKYDYKVWANDTNAGFGNKGGTIYGYTPAMENWEIAEITTDDMGKITLHIVYPYA